MAGSYTAADYLSWKFDGLVELIRGKIFKMSPAPGSNHQRVSSNLLRAFFRFFDHQPCEVFHAPYDVYLIHPGEDFRKTSNIVQPDVCVICDKSKIRREGCTGSPDLIVEILSPSNTRKDVEYKFALYEEYGVREYWIIHPAEGTVIVNVLQNGQYTTLRPLARGQVLQSALFPALRINLEDLFNSVQDY